MNPKNLKLILIVGGFILMVIILSKVIISGKAKVDNDLEATKNVTKAGWEQRWIGETGISLYAPDGMKEIQTTLDNNVKQVLEDYNAYEYKVGSFQMKLNHVVAKTRIDPVEYADRLAEMFEESGEYKGYSHKKIEVQEGGAFGIFMKGSGMYQGVDMVINSVILVKDNDLWEITVILNSSSHELKILMENIFSSPIIK